MAGSGDGVTITLKGNKDIRAAVQDLRDNLSKNFLRSALRKGAVRFRNAVLPAVPAFTGKLRANIAIKTKSRGGYIRARLVVNTVGGRDNSKNAFYWRFLEKGWRTKSGFHRHPFAESAIEPVWQQAAQDCVDAVDKALVRAEQRSKQSGA